MSTLREQIEQLHCAENVDMCDIRVNDGHSEWGASGAYTIVQVEETRASFDDAEGLPELPTADGWLRANGYVWQVVDDGIDSGALSAYHSEDTLEELAQYWTDLNGGGEGSFDIEIDGDTAWAILPDGERSEAARRFTARTHGIDQHGNAFAYETEPLPLLNPEVTA